MIFMTESEEVVRLLPEHHAQTDEIVGRDIY